MCCFLDAWLFRGAAVGRLLAPAPKLPVPPLRRDAASVCGPGDWDVEGEGRAADGVAGFPGGREFAIVAACFSEGGSRSKWWGFCPENASNPSSSEPQLSGTI